MGATRPAGACLISVVAQMIDVVILGDRPHPVFVGPTMSADARSTLASEWQRRVAMAIDVAGHVETARTQNAVVVPAISEHKVRYDLVDQREAGSGIHRPR